MLFCIYMPKSSWSSTLLCTKINMPSLQSLLTVVQDFCPLLPCWPYLQYNTAQYNTTSLTPARNLGRLGWITHSWGKSNATNSYQCKVFSCVQTMVWLPVFGLFNVCKDILICEFLFVSISLPCLFWWPVGMALNNPWWQHAAIWQETLLSHHPWGED